MRSTVPRWVSLRCVALLLALTGLLAMHGLGDHGAMTSDEMPAHTMGSMAAPMTVPAHLVHEVADVALSAPHGPLGSTVDGMAGLCLAVLVLALGAVLLGRAVTRRPLLALAARPAPLPLARGRAPDPPDLLRLSVQRC